MIHSWHITVSWEAVLSAENSEKPLGSRGSHPNSAGDEGACCSLPKNPRCLPSASIFVPLGLIGQSTPCSFPARCLGVWIKHWGGGSTLQCNWRSPRVVRFSWLAIDPVCRSMIPREFWSSLTLTVYGMFYPELYGEKNVNTDRIMNFFYEKCMLKRAPCRLRGCKNSISWPDVVQGD